jgi:outer membrane protein assembly factor BamB
MSPRCLMALSALTLLVAAAAPRAHGADWPQWRGPNRDDVSTEAGLLKSWPEGGPPRSWLFEKCGVGYSGPAIVGDRLYIMGARDGDDQLITLNSQTGEELWTATIAPMLDTDSMHKWGGGARGTPTVDGDRIYTIGSQGTLVCVSAANGDVVWKKSMPDDLGGKTPNWGYCESPLVYGDLVVCTPGGEKGSIAALNKATGEVVWQSEDLTKDTGYSSIVVLRDGAAEQLVQLTPEQLVGLDPKTGAKLWGEPWGGNVAVIPTPIVKDRLAYCTSGYGRGCMLVRVGDNNAVEKLYDNKVMKNKHGGVLLIGDSLFGHSDGAGWMCQDLMTGDIVWRERDKLEMGSITAAEGRLYLLGEKEGEVVLIEASTEAWKEHGRFKLDPLSEERKPDGGIWTHPVIANGRLYLRDQNYVYCYDVRDPGLASAGGN